jgi:hypothetical protein
MEDGPIRQPERLGGRHAVHQDRLPFREPLQGRLVGGLDAHNRSVFIRLLDLLEQSW